MAAVEVREDQKMNPRAEGDPSFADIHSDHHGSWVPFVDLNDTAYACDYCHVTLNRANASAGVVGPEYVEILVRENHWILKRVLHRRLVKDRWDK